MLKIPVLSLSSMQKEIGKTNIKWSPLLHIIQFIHVFLKQFTFIVFFFIYTQPLSHYQVVPLYHYKLIFMYMV